MHYQNLQNGENMVLSMTSVIISYFQYIDIQVRRLWYVQNWGIEGQSLRPEYINDIFTVEAHPKSQGARWVFGEAVPRQLGIQTNAVSSPVGSGVKLWPLLILVLCEPCSMCLQTSLKTSKLGANVWNSGHLQRVQYYHSNFGGQCNWCPDSNFGRMHPLVGLFLMYLCPCLRLSSSLLCLDS